MQHLIRFINLNSNKFLKKEIPSIFSLKSKLLSNNCPNAHQASSFVELSRITVYLIPLFFALLTHSLVAQTRQDLTEKRQQLLAEIEQANQLLSVTQKDKRAVLDQYYTVQRQIRQRRQLITTLNEEMELSKQSIERTSGAITSLKADMIRLEEEYSEMARQAFRHKMNDNQLLFLFSAEGFSDGLKRWRYIQQYDEYRKKQANLIVETRSVLSEKLSLMKTKKNEQQDLLNSAKKQQRILQKELGVQNYLLKGIKADETRISRLIYKKRKTHRQLSAAIEDIISREIRSRVGGDRVNTAPVKEDNNIVKEKVIAAATPNTSSIARLSTDFRDNKGSLPWPVQSGIVTRHFGKQKHPIHKRIQITNNGIDIRATQNNKVTAVHSGQIAGFQYVPGYQNTLIVQHGNYYSVYSNLEKVVVKRGEQIRSGQLLGIAGMDSQNKHLEVHLEIWKGKQRLNPAVWLNR